MTTSLSTLQEQNKAFILSMYAAVSAGDMDTFVAAPEPFDPKRLAEQFTELHSNVDKVFHWAVTEAGRKQFGYELVAETGADS